MDRKAGLVLKILGLGVILFVYISNRPATKSLPEKDPWIDDYTLARTKATVENKHILMYFSGSDWSKSCNQLNTEVFEQDAFKSYARENLILLKLDFPQNQKNTLSAQQVSHNEALAARFNNQGRFPLVLIIDKNENVIMQTGYRQDGAADFIAQVEKKLTSL